MDRHELKHAIEGLLFASEKPLGVEEINLAFEKSLEPGEIRSLVEELKSEYETECRGFRLCEIAGGYQLLTDPGLSPILKRFYHAREKKKISQASLETLSVIAYKQPVTRAEIEFIRGVNVDGALKTILEKGLVCITGRKDMPGRPMLYGTTPGFLEHFGLKSLEELPTLKEFSVKYVDPALLPPELTQESL
jgi:segregation and condensation protein B